MATEDSDYFRKRVKKERIVGQSAVSPQARDAHLELARLYEEAAGKSVRR